MCATEACVVANVARPIRRRENHPLRSCDVDPRVAHGARTHARQPRTAHRYGCSHKPCFGRSWPYHCAHPSVRELIGTYYECGAVLTCADPFCGTQPHGLRTAVALEFRLRRLFGTTGATAH